MSNETLITTLNSLFGENFAPETVTIEKTATEYPKINLDIIRADMFLKVMENDAEKKSLKPHHYHIEIQTEPDGDIIIRILEYDLQKALDIYRLEKKSKGGKTDTEPLLVLCKSLVIQLKDGGNVPEKEYAARLLLPDGQIIRYTVPVMRYFDYDDKDLIDKKLYILLPFQLFSLRTEIDKIISKGDEKEIRKAILSALRTTKKIIIEIDDLYNAKKYDINDYDKIISALNELYEHLKKRYDIDKNTSKGVDTVVKSMINEKAVKRAEIKAEIQKAVEIAKNLLKMGLSAEQISKGTNLTIDEIKKIKI